MTPDVQSLLLTISLALVGAFFGLLCVIIGWIGSKIYDKVDEIAKSLITMAAELHDRINGIDSRLIEVETTQRFCHLKTGHSDSNGAGG